MTFIRLFILLIVIGGLALAFATGSGGNAMTIVMVVGLWWLLIAGMVWVRRKERSTAALILAVIALSWSLILVAIEIPGAWVLFFVSLLYVVGLVYARTSTGRRHGDDSALTS